MFKVPWLMTSIGIEKVSIPVVSIKKYSVSYRNRYSWYRPPLPSKLPRYPIFPKTSPYSYFLIPTP